VRTVGTPSAHQIVSRRQLAARNGGQLEDG
jgi:hypothetical protein